jgi:hypothetical protein
MAYDARRERIVLFGGRRFGIDFNGDNVSDDGLLGDVWEWDGTQWTFRMLVGLTPREEHAMAWDPLRRRVVLFGGRTEDGPVRQTHDWNGERWIMRDNGGNGSPSARYGQAMAFDPVNGVVLMHGGRGSQFWKDTWGFGQ